MGKIKAKIEEIRKKPEHIRLRYVWFSVVAVMVLVFSIWVASIRQMIREASSGNDSKQLEELKKQLGELKDQTPSFDGLQQTGTASIMDETEGFTSLDQVLESGKMDQGGSGQIAGEEIVR